MEPGFFVRNAINVSLNMVGAASYFGGCSWLLNIPLPIRCGTHLISLCDRASYMALYSSNTRVEDALRKEVITLGVTLVSTLALMLISGQANHPLSLLKPSVLFYSVIWSAFITLIQLVSDLSTFLIADHAIPYIYHHSGPYGGIQRKINELRTKTLTQKRFLSDSESYLQRIKDEKNELLLACKRAINTNNNTKNTVAFFRKSLKKH